MPGASIQPMLALLACPAAGSPRQYMIEKAFARHDLDWRYLTFEVSPENLLDAVKGLKVLGFRGGHCDPPHKEPIIAMLDRMIERTEHALRLRHRFDSPLGRGLNLW